MQLYGNEIRITKVPDNNTKVGGSKVVFGGAFAVVDVVLKCGVSPFAYRNVNLAGNEHREAINKTLVCVPLDLPVNLLTDIAFINCKQGAEIEYLNGVYTIINAPKVFTNVLPHIEFLMGQDLHKTSDFSGVGVDLP